MKKIIIVASFAVALFFGQMVNALDLPQNPQRSVFFGIDVGIGFDLLLDTRLAADENGKKSEAYEMAGFLMGFDLGVRFNETIGMQVGFYQLNLDADEKWGSLAGYRMGHLDFRLQIPTKSCQTFVLKIAPVAGSFFYGDVLGYEDNQTPIMGGKAGLLLEHEFGLTLVGRIEISYFSVYRKGMKDVLHLYIEDSDGVHVNDEGIKDFTNDKLIHILLLNIGVQLEWMPI